MKYYNHAFDIAFSLTSKCPTGDTVTGVQLREAIVQSLLSLTDEELVEVAGLPFDSYEESSNHSPVCLSTKSRKLL